MIGPAGGNAHHNAGWQWLGEASIKGSSEPIRMALLTASLIGIQFTWGIEMTYCTPYLLNLGLPKSTVSLVWIAGPLSGLIMQPIVGILADRSTSKFGRRRPYMLGGALIVVMALLVLGWTSELVRLFISDTKHARSVTILTAVLSIYAIDFAINAVQASSRSLIVDSLPTKSQQAGSAWAGRMVAIGHLLGYLAGAADLGAFFGAWLGSSQFKQLIIVSAFALLTTVGLTCWAVEERVLLSTGDDEDNNGGTIKMIQDLIRRARYLPRRISTVCWIQFWCWIGWFPFLFYSTAWIGELYMRFNADAKARSQTDVLAQVGRVGSTSLVVFSIVTLISSIMVPWLVQSPEEANGEFTPRPPAAIADFLIEVHKWKPSLISAWMASHFVFAGSMMFTPFVTSLHGATTLIAICGIPWALQCWAPFTILGIEINKMANASHLEAGYNQKSRTSIESPKHERVLFDAKDSQGDNTDAGVYLGILNLYNTMPQFIGTFISWAVFTILEPGKSPELAVHAHPDEHHGTNGPNAISVCLFIGAMAALLAANETRKTYERLDLVK